MGVVMIDKLRAISRNYLKTYNKKYKRFIFKKNDFKGRFYLLIGQRGVGKTTIMVQFLLNVVNMDYLSDKILYVPMDHIYTENMTMYEIVNEFTKYGVKYFCFDEIHKNSNWSKDLKSVYDEFKDVKILASGSSLIKLHKESFDLSRRVVSLEIPGLSLREFIEINNNIEGLPSFSAEEIFLNYEKISYDITDFLEKHGIKILPLFKKYLKYGYFPYFFENTKEEYYIKLQQDIRKIIYGDLIAVYPDITGNTVNRIFRLLKIISESVPFTPVLNDIKEKLGIGDIRTLKNYFYFLEELRLINTISKKGRGLDKLVKPEKIFLNNTNYMYVLCENINKGNLRETFFVSNFKGDEIRFSRKGDFIIKEKYTVEVGGKSKKKKQIAQKENAYLVVDDIEHGIGNKIPLWLFGFMY